MAAGVYILCAITSAACAIMLLRGFFRSQARLLLWSSICFIGFALNNILLYVDRIILPDDVDLSILRGCVALAGLLALLYGLIFDAD